MESTVDIEYHLDACEDCRELIACLRADAVEGLANTSPARTDGGEWARTDTGRALGTPLYMSPEQLRAQAIDGRSDIWAIGVVPFELLTGRRPFQAATDGELAVQIMTGRPLAIRTLLPDVAPVIEAVIARALQRDREARFQTMGDFLRALVDGAASRAAMAPLEAPAQVRQRVRYAVVAALLSAAVAVAAAAHWRRPVVSPPPSTGMRLPPPIALAPASPPLGGASSPGAPPVVAARRRAARPSPRTATPPASPAAHAAAVAPATPWAPMLDP